MECEHLPRGYLLAQVTYGDPNLPITPSHAALQVQGRVIDVVTSDFGFKEIVVQADHVAFP
jgi:hypothetical protein